MAFRFITLPLKRPMPPKENSNVDLKSIPSDVIKGIQTKRTMCTSQFELFCNVFEKGGKNLNSSWNTSEGREKMISNLVDAVNLYATEVATVLYKFPVFAYGYYYSWSSSLGSKQYIAFDDFRYDLQCMFFNVAVILMNITEKLLCWDMTPSNASALEKEGYRYLLQAAGFFDLVKEMREDVRVFSVGITKLDPPEEMTINFLEFCYFIALAQAQEIGTTKAVENDLKGDKALVAKLSHQVLKLYEEAKNVAESRITCSQEIYFNILKLVQVKVDVFRALTFSHAVSTVFESNPSEGMWFVSQFDKLIKIVVNHRDQARIKKRKIPFRGDDIIQGCCTIVQRNQERWTRINSMVHRAKTATGPISLPPPMVLAQKKEMKLPLAFPHQVVDNTPKLSSKEEQPPE
ncbi:putative replication factor A, 51kDa subunit [Trypanosoma theileri]|uniref:Putative replication factor A, 51kDa subunit n=1 Tax=Trypanosoma theileri TaxID=67003 RepID=A0A1X0NY42_9TRYP|nr:putative replication factor A, 51kDa subunit [Trypanosoma theileri]ORC89594.1 putative replication factor A, 51kDa subunit [Trypanosoma theileri]